MTLVRWTPARHTVQSDFDRVFEGLFGSADGAARARRWAPDIDLFETEDAFVLRADLPGLSHEDIELELTDNVLRLSGERRSESEEKVEGYYRFERSFGSFSRSMHLPKGVDPESVTASFDRGVLEVSIPKPEERKPRRIAIGSPAGSDQAVEAEGTERDES